MGQDGTASKEAVMNQTKYMKKTLTIIIVTFFSFGYAQVAIGKTDLSGIGSLLEFAGNTTTTETSNTKGIILPAVTSVPLPANSYNGTFIFDRQSNKTKFYENGVWKDMSDEGSGDILIPLSGNEVGNGVIIGSDSSVAKGVLILESSDKALVLPHIKNPHISVLSPYPGMMCYDTISNSIAIFDGTNWSYWK